MDFFLKYPNITIIILTIIGGFIGAYIEKLREKAPNTETKIDDNFIKLYDFLKEQSKKSAFRKIVYSIAKLMEVKYIKGEIKAEDRYLKLKELLKEKIEKGELMSLPTDWEKLVDEVINDFCVDDKYERLVAKE